jgi:ferrous iron transport protein B
MAHGSGRVRAAGRSGARLLTDGIIAGVGGVVVFLPQIVILFGFLAVLEDCGYAWRAAFLMDRVMSRRLSGKSFIPLLSSMACAVPGILARASLRTVATASQPSSWPR